MTLKPYKSHGRTLYKPADEKEQELFQHCAGGSYSLTKDGIEQFLPVFDEHRVHLLLLPFED